MSKILASRAFQAMRTMQPVRLSHNIDFEIGPHLLTRPKPKMPKGWDEIERRREIFQLDDGVPTFLKMGFWDNILYRLTACAVLGGNVWSFYTLYQYANMP
nr:PREDICTED: cytochrome c oxidase subunit 7A1, mitochondrial-like [Bemisia tabaci]